MERKIMGGSYLVISLPRHWVKLNELKQGDVVSLSRAFDGSRQKTPDQLPTLLMKAGPEPFDYMTKHRLLSSQRT